MPSLCISSFNCKNVKTSIGEITKLCDFSDIILLQETWLHESEGCMLSQLNDKFYANSLSSNVGFCIGRPHGGLGILWKKSLCKNCKIVNYGDQRILGLELNVNGTRFLFVNVYLPCDSYENDNDFINYLAKINNIVECYDSPYVFVMGDFNANLHGNADGVIYSRFGKKLYDFCRNENLTISDYDMLGSDSYTFVSGAHNTVSWLDHIMTTTSGHELIASTCIDNSFISSDHLPLLIKLNVDTSRIRVIKLELSNANNNKVDWSEVSAAGISAYRVKSKEILSLVDIDVDLLTCNRESCHNADQNYAIDT